MSGPADQPAEQGEDLTLEGILREAGCLAPEVRPLTAHEIAVSSFIGAVPATSTSGRLTLEVRDPLAQVIAWAREVAGREVGANATWARFIRNDLQRGAVFIASNPEPNGSAELLVIADRGMLGRGLLVDAAKWAFLALGLTKAVVHVPAGRDDLADFARRAGFVFEGVSRGHFRGEVDAGRWSMLARECRWLSPGRDKQPVPPGAAIPSPPSLKVH